MFLVILPKKKNFVWPYHTHFNLVWIFWRHRLHYHTIKQNYMVKRKKTINSEIWPRTRIISHLMSFTQTLNKPYSQNADKKLVLNLYVVLNCLLCTIEVSSHIINLLWMRDWVQLYKIHDLSNTTNWLWMR